MLKHIVMWRLKPEAEGKNKTENALWMKEHLEALVGVVPELLSAEVGININPSSSSFDAVLVSTFNSKEDMELYKIHPKHVEISNYCKKIREERVDCDYFI